MFIYIHNAETIPKMSASSCPEIVSWLWTCFLLKPFLVHLFLYMDFGDKPNMISRRVSTKVWTHRCKLLIDHLKFYAWAFLTFSATCGAQTNYIEWKHFSTPWSYVNIVSLYVISFTVFETNIYFAISWVKVSHCTVIFCMTCTKSEKYFPCHKISAILDWSLHFYSNYNTYIK